MNSRHAIAALAILLPLRAEDPDLLRFTNGDQLQGDFGGIGGSGRIVWTRPDVNQPMEFQREKIRQIVLKGGHPLPLDTDSSHVSLVNGDRIPGRILFADANTVSLETSVGGTLNLPRDTVATFSPNPFGGRLLYAGPFDDRRWSVVGLTPEAEEPAPENAAAENAKPVWNHSGAAWYYRQGSDALVLDADMPDRALIRFKMSWRSSPNIALAFHADLAKAGAKDKEADEREAARRQFFGGPQTFARYFGNCYVATFQPSYNNLYRCTLDEDGQPRSERIRSGNTPMRMNSTGEAVFEVRCDRKSGLVALYIDGELAVQWSTIEDGNEGGAPYTAPGGALGFQVMGGSTPVRISDLIVAEWNGMTDSARSMDSEEHDIVLLGNGTDRFSGRVTAIQDGHLELDGKYAGLKIPLDEVAEVHFARGARRKPEEPPVAEVAVHFQPVGRISGLPVSATGGRMKLDSPLAGALDLDLSPAVLIEFQSAGGFLDVWDDDF